MESRIWIEKYRPRTLDDVDGMPDLKQILRQCIRDNVTPNMLFYGPPGTGKTTIVHAFLHDMYGDDYTKSLLEMNASNERSINDIRNIVEKFASVRHERTKFVFLDEADSMTKEAQMALKKLIEDSVTTRFFLACNNVSKIDIGVQSRCMQFSFTHIGADAMFAKIRKICDTEGIVIQDDAIKTLIRHVNDYRQVLNTLQQFKLGSLRDIDTPIVRRFLKLPPLEVVDELIRVLRTETFKVKREIIMKIYYDNVYSLKDILYALITTTVVGPVIPQLCDLYYNIHLGCNQEIIALHLSCITL